MVRTFSALSSSSEVVINLGNVMDIDGTSTYLTTGPVVVGHSLTEWVLLGLELELWLLELHWLLLALAS